MYKMVARIAKWASIPVLLIGSVFSRYAASYELTVDLAICLGATILVLRAVWMKEYSWAAGFVSIAIVFSPLLLAVKVFFLMGLTCMAVFLALLTALRRHPLPVA